MCMNAYGYSLDNPRVQAVRDEFCRSRQRRHKISTCQLDFDRIWKLLCDDRNSMDAIAKIAGVHKTSILQLYENYFMQFFGNKTAIERARAIWDRRRLTQVRRLSSTLPDVPWIQSVKRLAGAAGLSVKPRLVDDGYGHLHVSPRLVSVSDVLCSGRPITRAFRRSPTGQPYAALSFCRSSVSNVPCYVAPILLSGLPEASLVLPAEIVEERLFSGTNKVRATVVFPLRRLTIEERDVQFDVAPFINAWHLIPDLRNAQTALA